MTSIALMTKNTPGQTPSSGRKKSVVIRPLLPRTSLPLPPTPPIQIPSRAVPPRINQISPGSIHQCICDSELCHTGPRGGGNYGNKGLYTNYGCIKLPACTACHQKRKKCDIVRPCRRCVKYGVECVERSAHPSKRRKVESIITSRLCSVHGCMVGDMNGVKGPTVGRHNNGLPSLVSDISMETSSYSLPPSPASTATSARDASPISISDVAPSPGLPATPTTDSGQGRSERDIYASLAGIYSQEDGIVRAFYGSGYGVNNQEIGGHEMSEAVASALLDDILRELPGPSAEAPRLEIRNTKFMRVPIYGIQGNAEAETELFKMLEEDCDVMMPMNTAEREQTTGQTFDFMQIENLLDTDYAADTIQNNTISGFDDSVSQPNLDFSYYSNPVPDMEESGHNAIVDFTAADDFMACIDFGMGGDLSCLEFPEDWRFGSDDLVLAPVSTLSSNTNDNIGPS